jgi:hypothetical protein
LCGGFVVVVATATTAFSLTSSNSGGGGGDDAAVDGETECVPLEEMLGVSALFCSLYHACCLA